MGQPVVRFEVMGKDADKLQGFYSGLFDWEIDSHHGYGRVSRDANVNEDGVGIDGGIGAMPGAGEHLTFYVEVPDIEAALVKSEELGGSRLFGPAEVNPGLELGFFADPEGNKVGVIRSSG